MSTNNKRLSVKRSIRKKINGTHNTPRLTVFRSNKEIYAQLVDDVQGHTLCACSSKDKGLSGEKGNKSEIAFKVGEALATKAMSAGINNVCFDRNGYIYHGRIKQLAEGARKGGLKCS